MIDKPRTSRRRGEPLLALALLMATWTGARMLLWHSPFPTPFAVASANAATPPQNGLARENSQPALNSADNFTKDLAPVATRPKAFGQGSAMTIVLPRTDEQPASKLSTIERPKSLPGFAPYPTAVSRDVALLAQPSVALPLHVSRRWHVAGWIAWRAGSGVPRRADGPRPASYGGSQAGAVARLDLAGGGHRPAVHLRAIYAPDRFRQADFAAGVGLRPISQLPVRMIGEVRLTHSQGRSEIRPAVLAVTELPPIELPLGLTAEGYGQAGWVGGDYSTSFVDGQVRVKRQVLSSGRARVHVGAGAWGGAQKFAERIDVGPTIGLDIDAGPVLARLALDYRVQVSGNATPGNGPALTLSTGF